MALSSSSSPVKYPQSAPVNVPILSKEMKKELRRHYEKDEEEEETEEGEMLPPHEIVARKNSAEPSLFACSFVEGVGKTLKRRDLRQVRNAVWRRTGFSVIDI